MVDERRADGLRERLRDELRVAMKQRDKAAVAAVRAALGVIDNAEAADLSHAPGIEPGLIAGGVAGLGAGEVARRHLSDDELVEMLRDEVARWESTARAYERARRSGDATQLRAEIAALRPFLAGAARPRHGTS
jgi:uncharacterized protein